MQRSTVASRGRGGGTDGYALKAHRCLGLQAAERAWDNAQPENALLNAAVAGDLAKCTRLLGAGTHPVGWKVSGPNWLPPAAPNPLELSRVPIGHGAT